MSENNTDNERPLEELSDEEFREKYRKIDKEVAGGLRHDVVRGSALAERDRYMNEASRREMETIKQHPVQQPGEIKK